MTDRRCENCRGKVEPSEYLRVTKRLDGRGVIHLCEECALDYEAIRKMVDEARARGVAV